MKPLPLKLNYKLDNKLTDSTPFLLKVRYSGREAS